MTVEGLLVGIASALVVQCFILGAILGTLRSWGLVGFRRRVDE